MAGQLKAEELANLDKQTLITLLMDANSNAEKMRQTIDQMNRSLSILTEEVSSLRQQRFGRKSERNLSDFDGQYTFIFNETEVTIDLCRKDSGTSETEETETEEISYRRKKPVGKRKSDLSKIREREVILHELSEAELREKFPDGRWSRLPDEVYERVDFVPAKLKVYEHHVAVYKGTATREIVKAPRPADLLRNSIATPGFVAAAVNAKFVNAVPVNRLA